MIPTRLAANKVIIDGEKFTNHVVELGEDVLVRHYPLTEELPHTQWVRTLVIEEGRVIHSEPC